MHWPILPRCGERLQQPQTVKRLFGGLKTDGGRAGRIIHRARIAAAKQAASLGEDKTTHRSGLCSRLRAGGRPSPPPTLRGGLLSVETSGRRHRDRIEAGGSTTNAEAWCYQ